MPTAELSKSPRTDAAELPMSAVRSPMKLSGEYVATKVVLASFARALEIELGEAVAKLSGFKAKMALQYIANICEHCGRNEDGEGRCAYCLTTQIAVKDEALNKIWWEDEIL